MSHYRRILSAGAPGVSGLPVFMYAFESFNSTVAKQGRASYAEAEPWLSIRLVIFGLWTNHGLYLSLNFNKLVA